MNSETVHHSHVLRPTNSVNGDMFISVTSFPATKNRRRHFPPPSARFRRLLKRKVLFYEPGGSGFRRWPGQIETLLEGPLFLHMCSGAFLLLPRFGREEKNKSKRPAARIPPSFGAFPSRSSEGSSYVALLVFVALSATGFCRNLNFRAEGTPFNRHPATRPSWDSRLSALPEDDKQEPISPGAPFTTISVLFSFPYVYS